MKEGYCYPEDPRIYDPDNPGSGDDFYQPGLHEGNDIHPYSFAALDGSGVSVDQFPRHCGDFEQAIDLDDLNTGGGVLGQTSEDFIVEND